MHDSKMKRCAPAIKAPRKFAAIDFKQVRPKVRGCGIPE
jgi:hypothetical protein